MTILYRSAVPHILLVLIWLILTDHQPATAQFSNIDPLPAGASSIILRDNEDDNWADGFSLGGPDSVVQALVTDHIGNLYASGNFLTVGGVTANHIARWDGTNWTPLGDGLEAAAGKLIVDSHGNVYTDILSHKEDGFPVTLIIRWDGSSWSTIGGDLGLVVDTLAEDRQSNIVINALVADAQDNLYAGGYVYLLLPESERYVGFVARWDGSTWTLLGSGMDNTVYSLAVDADGVVYAGGEFSHAGGVPARRVAKWDGNTWSPLGGGLEDTPNILVTDHDENLYAAVAGQITKWEGSSWNIVGRPGGDVVSIFNLAFDQSNTLYAGGWFTSVDGVAADYIASWDETAWHPLGSGTNREVYALAVDPNGRVYAGGIFSQAGGKQASFIAQWDGTDWAGLSGPGGNGTNLAVDALASDWDGNLYAAGYFSYAGTTQANRIARWDGAAWAPLGSGINDTIYSLTIDEKGNLYAGGAFTTAGDVQAKCIAKWDGDTWSPLGAGLEGWYIGALVTDGDGNLYAGGDFNRAGDVEANFIAQWDGNTWHALGTGLNDQVRALALDADSNLYAGGWFTEAGGKPANGVAKWDGNAWSALGAGMADVWALAVDQQGILYAGGGFTSAGDVSANYIAKWDGNAWSPVGSGMGVDPSLFPYPRVAALELDGEGNLYAGGDFTEAGGKTVNHVARWDGSSWKALGSGITGRSNSFIVLSLERDGHNNLYAGGDFTYAGGKPSANIARWTLTPGIGSNSNTATPQPIPVETLQTTPQTQPAGRNTSAPDIVPTIVNTPATAGTPQSQAGTDRIALVSIAVFGLSTGGFLLVRSLMRRS